MQCVSLSSYTRVQTHAHTRAERPILAHINLHVSTFIETNGANQLQLAVDLGHLLYKSMQFSSEMKNAL